MNIPRNPEALAAKHTGASLGINQKNIAGLALPRERNVRHERPQTGERTLMKTVELEKPRMSVESHRRADSPGPESKFEPPTRRAAKALRLKSLLLPTDFSDCSLKAVEYAETLARTTGGTIDLLNVVEPARIPHGLKMPYGDWEDLMVCDAHKRLSQIARDKIEDLIPVHSEVRIGRSYEEICAAAERRESDLIIIATHGRTGLKHLLLGSTAERVVRHAPCSVLVVRGLDAVAAKAQPRRILVPVDFSPCSKGAIRAAVALAKQFIASVTLVYVIPAQYPAAEYGCLDYATLEADVRESVKKDLSAISKKIASAGLSVAAEILHGRPATQIVEAAKAHKSDLIVISTHGRTGLNHVLMGSTAEEVVRHATCPVLTLREQKRPSTLETA